MRPIDIVREYLGDPYVVTSIDLEDVIYRNLGNGYEFEVSGIRTIDSTCSLYVWSENPRQIVGIYRGIKGRKNLKDLLGFYATKYQNLTDQIQVERED
ncbi:hypothetical protein [Anaerotruncus rubiinfantis]|uniref:hypothetical protein n=1 Tax=Anaerotruncus rubiinfantis TaxID=1720200 RepID=UPI001899F98E|nr:hypothetical protein [Anaerotruncus rubiinfantis]